MNQTLHRQVPTRRLAAAGPVLWQLTAILSGLILSAGKLFNGLRPLGLGLVMGAGAPYVVSAAAGSALGYLMFAPISESMRYIAAVMAALAGRALFRKSILPGMVGGCGVFLTVQLMLSMSGLSSPAQAVATLGETLLAAGFGVLLHRMRSSMTGWLGPIPPQGILMSLACVPTLCLLPGPFQPAISFLGAFGLVLAYRGRTRECAAFCIAGGMIVSAARPEFCFAGLGLAAACLAAGWATPGERTGSGAVFLSGCVFGSLAAPDSMLALGFLGSAVLAEGLFLGMPRRWLAAVPGRTESAVNAGQRSQITGAAGRLELVAEALTDIADTVDKVYESMPKKGETFNWVVEQVSRELCSHCAQKESCWVENYNDSMDGFFNLKPMLEECGRVSVEQLPGQFCRCIHPAELCSASSRAYTLYRSRRESRVKAGAMREAVTEQYTAMAGALAGMAEQLGQSLAPDEGKTARLSSLFASIGLEPLEIQVGYETTGRMRILVTVSRTVFSQEELEQLRDEAQRICRRPLGVFQIDHCGAVSLLRANEQAVYYPVFGLASHSAKPGACGDATEQFCDTFGNAHLMLCDGMGVGRPAAIDGNLAASLAARLLKAGFSASSTARLVNVALALKSDEESGATLDLVTVDLFTGRARLFKAGACPTFILRQGKAEELEGSSLPVGILSGVVGRQEATTLSENSMVVLVSDGVLCDGSGWLRQQMELCAAIGSTPQELADILADTALERAKSRGRPDDITVAVMRLDRVDS